MQKPTIDSYMMGDILKYMRPKKIYDLGKIPNHIMRALTKLYRTAYRHPDDLKPLAEQFMYDYLISFIDRYDEGYLLMNINEAIKKLEKEGNKFVTDYEKHFNDFCEFKGWLSPLEMLVSKKGIVLKIRNNLIERYDGIREELQNALKIYVPREKGLPTPSKLVNENGELSFIKKKYDLYNN